MQKVNGGSFKKPHFENEETLRAKKLTIIIIYISTYNDEYIDRRKTIEERV